MLARADVIRDLEARLSQTRGQVSLTVTRWLVSEALRFLKAPENTTPPAATEGGHNEPLMYEESYR